MSLSPPTPDSILDVQLLGPVTVRMNGDVLDIGPSRKETALLAYLLEAGKPQTREHLAELFWPDRSHELCLKNLRVLLTRLRKILPDHLEVTRTTISFNFNSAHATDVADLKKGLDQAQAGFEENGILTSPAANELNRALTLYRGQFLEGLQVQSSPAFEQWLERKRRDLRARVGPARRMLVEDAIARQDPDAGLLLTGAWLEEDVLLEDVHRLHMLLLAKSGQKALAVDHFQSLKNVLAQQLQVEPEEETLRLLTDIQSGSVHVWSRPLEESAPQQEENLLILLDKVHRFWIGEVLAESLPPEGAIPLRKALKPHLLQRSLRPVMTANPSSPDPAPTDTEIDVLFKQMGQALLITGPPGAGKTITLLLLAREALQWAKQDPHHPVPVVFHLASWSGRDRDLKQWMARQLNHHYLIPTAIAERWLAENRIFPLLDGLDEAPANSLTPCVRAINQFRRECGLIPIAVCAREEEYLDQGARLMLEGAVELKELEPLPIKRFLSIIGTNVDVGETHLLKLPLFLTMMRAMPQDLNRIEDLSEDALRHHLFTRFLDCSLKQDDAEGFISAERVKDQLGWLASHNLKHHQVLIDPDHIQPFWVKNQGLPTYLILSRTLCGLLVALLLALFSYRLNREANVYSVLPLLGIGAGLALAVLDGLTLLVPPSRWGIPARLLRILAVGGLCGSVAAGLSGWFLVQEYARISLVLFGVVFAVLFGAASPDGIWRRDIGRADRLGWSLQQAWRGAWAGLLCGALFSAVLLVVMHFSTTAPFHPWTMVPVILLFAGALGFLARGFSSRIIQKGNRPNLGIWVNPGRGAAAGLLAFGLIFSLFTPLAVFMNNGQLVSPMALRLELTPLTYGLNAGLLVGGLIFFQFGAFSLIKYGVLRWVLKAKSPLPWNLTSFLDQGVRWGLLRRTGGCYFFTHRQLMEHLSTQYLRERPSQDPWETENPVKK